MSTTITTSLRRWPTRAACRDADPDLFADRDREKWPRAGTVEVAHDYCARCPVRAACDAYAVREGLLGVWGGKWRHELYTRDGWSHTEVTDLLTPELAARPGTPMGIGGRRLKVWEAIPDTGYITPTQIGAAVGLDQRQVCAELQLMADLGLVASPRRGVWRRDGDVAALDARRRPAPRPASPLADGHRTVLAAVSDIPTATGALIEATGLDRVQVRRALEVLVGRGLVTSPRWGFWCLPDPTTAEAPDGAPAAVAS